MLMNIVDWEYTDNIAWSQRMGYVQTNYQHLVNVLGEPQWTDDEKTTAKWAVLATIQDEAGEEEDVLFTIYDWKMPRTPMGDYQWHICVRGRRAVELAEWFLAHDRAVIKLRRG